ncbi:MAG: NADPH-dependent FMN reductase [Chitinophagaceae bacterium]
MYVIISGTNRKGSTSFKVAGLYQKLLEEKGIKATLISLVDLDLNGRTPKFDQLEENALLPADKFLFIIPEYNGSFPGALKMLIDLSSHRKVWAGKKALMTGVASGRAGNLRGMEHLTGTLNYLEVVVHPNRLPISSIDKLMDDQGNLTDPSTLEVINKQIEQFITF